MLDRWSRFAAVTGILFVAAIVASIVVSGNTPNADAKAAAVVTFFKANRNSQLASNLLGAIASVFLAFFGAQLWNRLRAALPGSALPAAGLVGVAIAAAGGAIFSGVGFSLADVPDKIDPSAAQALNVLSNDFFFPLAAGISIFLIADGLTIARSGLLPRWLGWVGMLIGVVAMTPVGFIAFLAAALWVLVVSIWLLLRDLRAVPGRAPAAAG